MSEFTGSGGRRRGLGVVVAFAVTDALVLIRARTPVIFMFVVPLVLSLMLGPAVTGDSATHPGRSMTGFAVLFSFMTINYVGLALYREFFDNTWIRQSALRIPKVAFIVGRVIPVAGIGLLQLVVFGWAAFTFYRLPLHGNVGQLLLVAVLLSLVGPPLGVILYNLTPDVSTFQGLTFVLLLGTGGAGGAIVAPDRLPPVVAAIGLVTPHHWAMAAFSESTVGTGDWRATLTALAVLGSMVVVLMTAATASFDFRAEKRVLV
jgi:ABC-2 type transport system permease protein